MTQETIRQRLDRYSIPEPNSGCLLWTGFANPRGYGRVNYRGRLYLAHRLSWMEAHGHLDPQAVLLHKCDNPGCINPDHLTPGTQAANVADMLAKGRENRDPRPNQRGKANGNSKLDESTVRAIFLSPLSQKRAAKAFGVAQSWVWRIRRAEVWPHVTMPLLNNPGGTP